MSSIGIGQSRTNSRVTLKMKSPPNMRVRKPSSSAGSMFGQPRTSSAPLVELRVERRAIDVGQADRVLQHERRTGVGPALGDQDSANETPMHAPNAWNRVTPR